jgi:hypothetical protein
MQSTPRTGNAIVVDRRFHTISAQASSTNDSNACAQHVAKADPVQFK